MRFNSVKTCCALAGLFGLVAPATQAQSTSKALALGWQGYADTDLKFSEFFGAEHTIMFRFMAQYPNGYEGPAIAENGTGKYFIGQGDFQNGTPGDPNDDNPRLLIQIGEWWFPYKVNLQPGTWHHLALVATINGGLRKFQPYLDGAPLAGALTTPLNGYNFPSGTLRFGKRTSGQKVNERDAQFYGLLDDVAVITKALTPADIQYLSKNDLELTGNEIGLLAGYTFDGGSQPTKLTRPVTLHNWSAKRVTVSANRSNTDAAAIPLPFSRGEMALPFKPGEAWSVIQPFDNGWVKQADGTLKVGSHNGYAAFCWDFKVAGYGQDSLYPHGTRMAPFYASGRGNVTYLSQDSMPQQDPANSIEITQASGEIASYLHLYPYSSFVSVGNWLGRGAKLALASNTGTTHDHLHFGAKNLKYHTTGFLTFPIAFSNYDLKNEAGEWHRVLRGMPLRDQVIRVPEEPDNRYVAIWRNDGTDAFHDEHMEFASFQDYKAAYDKIFPQGWRLHNLVANVVDGVVYYNAVWRPDTASETQVYSKSFSEYKAKYDELSATGWRLHILQSYVLNGKVLYNAVWRKSSADEIPVFGAPYATYRSLYDTLWPAGWRLHILQSYVLNGQVLYNAVFRQVGGSETQSYGITLTALSDRNATLKAQGLRLSIVQGYVVNGKVYYNAVWVHGTAEDYSIFDGLYSEFRAHHDDKRSDGWRLHRLDLYHQ